MVMEELQHLFLSLECLFLEHLSALISLNEILSLVIWESLACVDEEHTMLMVDI